MGKRNTARRLAMQAIYQADLASQEISISLANLFEAEKFIAETKEFASCLAEKAWQKRGWADEIISQLAIDWPLERIGKVDRSILRLALSELKDGETPSSVVANEAVELAKKYSSEESARFINGIVGAYLRNLEKKP